MGCLETQNDSKRLAGRHKATHDGRVIIRPRRNAKGEVTCYQVDYGMVDGVRKRESFGDEMSARRALEGARAARTNLGLMGLQATPGEMAEFLTVKARLPAGTSITEAMEFFMREGMKVTRPVLVPKLVEDFVWSRRELGRDKRTIHTYTHVFGSLARAFPLTLAHELRGEDVRRWARSTGWSAGTQNKAVGHVRSLFRWAVAQKHAAVCPCEGMEALTTMKEEIGTLELRECELLLRLALRVPRFMPFVCLGLFRGMRRAEMERLRLRDWDWKDKSVIVEAKKVKTRRRRVVDLEEIVLVWMRAAGWKPSMMEMEGPLVPSNLKDLWPRFWKAAGLHAWPDNGLRHTFASMHYAMHQDETLLQAILGHESDDVLHTNYRALKRRSEAVKFWRLRPPRDWTPLKWGMGDAVFGFV